jgi:hypothetical protein
MCAYWVATLSIMMGAWRSCRDEQFQTKAKKKAVASMPYVTTTKHPATLLLQMPLLWPDGQNQHDLPTLSRLSCRLFLVSWLLCHDRDPATNLSIAAGGTAGKEPVMIWTQHKIPLYHREKA